MFNVDRFELIKKNDLLYENKENIQKKFHHVSFWGTQSAAIDQPKNIEQQNKDLFSESFSGISIAQRPERYVDLEKVTHQIQARARNLNELKQYNSSVRIDEILRKYPQANAWVPLKANAVDMTVLVNKEKAEVVKIVDLRPWN